MRVGIVNLMPQAERYEQMLRGALARAHALHPGAALSLTFIRLAHHAYRSSDADHLRTHYVDYATAVARGPLDRLLVTGAPVEELPFSAVRYWPELRAILLSARETIPSTLGVCWGGMALAELLGVAKSVRPSKLLGIYPVAATRTGTDEAVYAQSRHAAITDATLEAAERAGRVRLVAYGAASGYTIFASTDGRYLAHLGHPEYDPGRLLEEYERDRHAGRTDVAAPEGVSQWASRARDDGARFLAGWLWPSPP